MYEQSVDWPAAGRDESYGLPGPPQRTDDPSPIDHTTATGDAVTDAVTAPADADADTARQPAPSTHNHDSKFTYCSPDGLNRTEGTTNAADANAWLIRSGTDTAGGAVPAGTHTGGNGAPEPGEPAPFGSN